MGEVNILPCLFPYVFITVGVILALAVADTSWLILLNLRCISDID